MNNTSRAQAYAIFMTTISVAITAYFAAQIEFSWALGDLWAIGVCFCGALSSMFGYLGIGRASKILEDDADDPTFKRWAAYQFGTFIPSVILGFLYIVLFN